MRPTTTESPIIILLMLSWLMWKQLILLDGIEAKTNVSVDYFKIITDVKNKTVSC